jgi:metal-responsive CopG/Arc/MetJ family transcriptional regulator
MSTSHTSENIAVSLTAAQLAALDAWIAAHKGHVSRDEAIRMLVGTALGVPDEASLATSTPARPPFV